MTFQTGTATDYKDLLTKLVQVATGNSIATFSVAAGGTGYTVGDILTATGGTFSFAATFEVLTAPGGVVATVRLVTGGAYTVDPSSPVSTSGGTGTGCTITVTFASNGWTALRDTTPSGEKEVILEGNGSGTDSILIGIKTYSVTGQDGFTTARNWTCVGMTAFNSGLAFEAQAGVSPGAVPVNTGGAYVPLKAADAFNITFWFFITSRRIIMIAKVETVSVTNFVSCYLGWMNPFGTASEFPYPILIAGCTGRHDALYFATGPTICGISDPWAISGRTGPMYYRKPDSTWQTIKNSDVTDSGGTTRSVSKLYTLYPTGQSTIVLPDASADNIVIDTAFTFDDIIPGAGLPGTQNFKLEDTPNGGGTVKLLVPSTVVISSGSDIDSLGELDGVYWFSATGGVSSGDIILEGTDRFLVFQCGHNTAEFSFMAIRED